jgi:hypothetical protein
MASVFRYSCAQESLAYKHVGSGVLIRREKAPFRFSLAIGRQVKAHHKRIFICLAEFKLEDIRGCSSYSSHFPCELTSTSY